MLKKYLSFLMVLAMLMTTVAIPAFASTGVSVGIEVKTVPTAVGEVFNADVYISGLSTLRMAQFTVGYDPTKIQPVLANGNAAVNFQGSRVSDITSLEDEEVYFDKIFTLQSSGLNTSKGLIDFTYSINPTFDSSYTYEISNPSDKFVVVKLRFKVLALGNAGLRIATSADGAGNYTEANPKGYALAKSGTEMGFEAAVVQPNLVIGPTGPVKTDITDVTNPAPKSVAYGTPFAELGLPATVAVTDGTKTEDILVTWTEADYNPTVSGEQTINGTLDAADLDEKGFTNTNNYQPRIVVTVGQKPNEDQAAPTGLQGVAPTTADNNDGKIVGTSALMEYRLSTDATYTQASDGETTGLQPGTYYVRYAARTGYNASPEVQVVIEPYVAPVVGSAVLVSPATVEAGTQGSISIKVKDIPADTKNIDIFVSYEGKENFTNVKLAPASIIEDNAGITVDTSAGTIGFSAFVKEGVTLAEEQEVATITFTAGEATGDYKFTVTSAFYGDETAFDNLGYGTVTVTEASDPNYQLALDAVVAFENAPLNNLDDVEDAEELYETALEKVNLVKEGTAKQALLERIAVQKEAVEAARNTFEIAAALARVNQAEDATKLTFTIADLVRLGVTGAVEEKLGLYHLVVGAQRILNDGNVAQSELQDLVTIANGTYEKGDVNGSGNILSADAMLVKKYYLNDLTGSERLTPEQVMVADWDSDGILDDADVSNILLEASKGNF